MRCQDFEAGRCRSCSLLAVPYEQQLAQKAQRCAELLRRFEGLKWADPVPSPEEGFRNKAKMVVSGTPGNCCLGIRNELGHGVDLSGCPLYPAELSRAFSPVRSFIDAQALAPYDVARRQGELKFVLFTVAEPSGHLMIRFVLQSASAIPKLRASIGQLARALPNLALVSANLQPEHKAILEGDDEVHLYGLDALCLTVNDIVLYLPPKSFFQTNTTVASALYDQARAWANDLDPQEVLDLFSGVGGFALHLGKVGRNVMGVELSDAAVAGAKRSAAELGLDSVHFEARDALAYAEQARELPELVVVNPPRRGLGPELAGLLDDSKVRWLLYSSCNPATLARDLEAMPRFTPARARLFDMFPHTEHFELLTLLERAPGFRS